MARKNFADTLRLLGQGNLLDEASSKLRELLQAINLTGKAGTLTLQLEFKPQGPALQVKASVNSKMPAPKIEPDILWSTEDGELTQQNPKQQSLELREVPPPAKGDLKTAT